MIKIYNIVIRTVEILIQWSSRLLKDRSKSKYSLFVKGQKSLIDHIQADMQQKRNCPTIWFHAASLGEYAVARPLISRLKQDGDCTIIVTFFSSTGYEAIKGNHPQIDYLYYLPLDTQENVRHFLDAVRPDKVVFIISEFWCNYLQELKERNIPTYLVSAIIRKKSPFFKWYGGIFRQSLAAYTHFFVLDEESKTNLNTLGFENVTISGDPLFDNAAIVAQTTWENPIIDRFSKEGDLFVAGSISDKKDFELVKKLAGKHRDTHFVFVPHEISGENLDRIKSELGGRALCYSECDENTDFSSTQVLIIDFLGALAYLYRYAKWAYIGGGFTPFLHSVIEATVYGVPVSFGPKIHRKVTPKQLVKLRIGKVIRRSRDLDRWFSGIKNNELRMKRNREVAANYVAQNMGATDRIMTTIEQGIWERN